jgi:hypothetical protein
MGIMKVEITLGKLRLLEENGTVLLSDGIELVLLKPENVATGAEIKDFWDNGWDGNYYHDDWDEPVQDDDGKWILEDGKLYNLDRLGYCCWQGPSSGVGARRYDQPATIPFVEMFLAWKGKK